MEILIHSFNYPPNDGGIARLTWELFNNLKQHEYDVKLITHEKQLKKDDNIEIVPKKRLISEILSWWKLRKFNGYVISTIWYPEGLICSFFESKKKIILVHGSELLPHTNEFKNWIFTPLKKFTLSRADLIVANSHFTAQLVKSISKNSKIVVNTPAVNQEKFQPRLVSEAKKKWDVENKFIISTVAVIQRHKGYDTVFKALQKIPQKIRENLVYLIAGEGTYKTELKDKAIQMGLEGNIKWLGFVDDDDLINVYNLSDLFVLCSKSLIHERNIEGFGMVLLEAQACGTTVVGSKSGGIPDAVILENGNFLIEEGDNEHLAKIICDLYLKKVNDPESQSNLNHKALKSWDDYTKLLVSSLEELDV